MAKHPRGIHQMGRRLFLRGAAGAVVSLPLLETFFPKYAKPADMTFRYAVFMRQGNGVQQGIPYGDKPEPDRFWPTKLGALTTAGMNADGDQAVNVLADYAAKLLLVRGCKMANMGPDAGCGHSQGGLLCLTAASVDAPNVQNALATDESIDNRIVRELQGEGVEPLTLRAGPRSGYLDDVLSYRGAGVRRVAQSSPLAAYNALFPMSDVDDGQALALRRKGVNDLVRAEMAALLANTRLSKEDRDRLEAHRQAIRDLELNMQCAQPPGIVASLDDVNDSQVEQDDYIITTARLQSQVIALAMACGRVHAATLQIGHGNDGTQYTINGQKYERFHHISHRINSDGAEGSEIVNADVKHHEIDKLFAGIFKDLVKALDDTKTPTGTLLDEGVAVWLNDLSNGPPHSTENMPYVCAGSCGGQLKTGAYVDAGNMSQNQYVTHNKFLNTLGAAVGCKNGAGQPLDDFGDGGLEKGRIPQMLKA
jgi:hypothetical protein